MLNVYLIYVSSLETGDVDISKCVYTSYGKAIEEIDNMIQQYVTDRKAEKAYRIVSKDEFDRKKLNKDSTISVGSYIFRKKKSSAWIYKKVTVEGRIWNGSKLEKVGKIGVLPEINIPVDKKLLKLIHIIQDQNRETESIESQHTCEETSYNTYRERMRELNNDEIKSEETEDAEEEDLEVLDENESDDEYNCIKPIPSNYQHGQHVSFIKELKERLEKRRNSIMAIDILETKVKIGEPNEDHQHFINNLSSIRANLYHVTPPPSPDFGLGRVISKEAPRVVSRVVPRVVVLEEVPRLNEILEEISEVPDFPKIPDLPPLPLYELEEDSSELSSSSDWDSSTEEILLNSYEYQPMVPNVTDTEESTEVYIGSYDQADESDELDICDEKIIPDPPEEKEYTHKEIEKIVEEIWKTIDQNNTNITNTPEILSEELEDIKVLDETIEGDSTEGDSTEGDSTEGDSTEGEIEDSISNIAYDGVENSFNEPEEWVIIEYYEDTWNSEPMERKYIDVDRNRRLSI